MSKAFISRLNKEDQEQIAFNRFLSFFKYRKNGVLTPLFWKHNGNEAKRNKAAIIYWKLMGGKAGLPDIEIIDPYGDYNGLAIELKKTGFKLYTRDGHLKKDKHIQNQARILQEYSDRGWYACFAVGVIEAQEIVRSYFSKNQEEALAWYV